MLSHGGGFYAQVLPPPVQIQLLCSDKPRLVALSLQVSSMLKLLDAASLRRVVIALHPELATGLRPAGHIPASAECFLLAFLFLLEQPPTATPPASVQSRKSIRQVVPSTDDEATPIAASKERSNSSSADPPNERTSIDDFLSALKTLHGTYNSASVLDACLEHGCFV